MDDLIGKELREFDDQREWELHYEDMILVILKPRRKFGRDVNLIGVSSDDLRVRWSLGGRISDPDAYDGIKKVVISDGSIWALTSVGFAYKIDYKTGEVLDEEFHK